MNSKKVTTCPNPLRRRLPFLGIVDHHCTNLPDSAALSSFSPTPSHAALWYVITQKSQKILFLWCSHLICCSDSITHLSRGISAAFRFDHSVSCSADVNSSGAVIVNHRRRIIHPPGSPPPQQQPAQPWTTVTPPAQSTSAPRPFLGQRQQQATVTPPAQSTSARLPPFFGQQLPPSPTFVRSPLQRQLSFDNVSPFGSPSRRVSGAYEPTSAGLRRRSLPQSLTGSSDVVDPSGWQPYQAGSSAGPSSAGRYSAGPSSAGSSSAGPSTSRPPLIRHKDDKDRPRL
jgi:hypothetical protein